MPRLEEMLRYVSEHNDYYKKVIRENRIIDPTDITQYPVLTRQQLQENRYGMFSDGYKLKYYNQQLRRQSSSGSSGVPVNVYWDEKDWYVSNLSLWRRRWDWYQIKPGSRRVMFTLKSFEMGKQEGSVQYMIYPGNVLTFNITLVHNIQDYISICRIIQKFDPEWLYIQPHILSNLLVAYDKTTCFAFKSLRYIETVGEMLSPVLKQRAADVFCVPIADMYGSEEMNGIAYECPQHHMHILGDNAFVEVMHNDGSITRNGEGKAVVTNLNNHAMPLIRYLQGDVLFLPNEAEIYCGGHQTGVIRQIKGRCIESITLAGGSEINTYTLSEIVSDVNNRFSDIILEYHYVYKQDTNELVCYVLLEKSRAFWAPNVKTALAESFSAKIPKGTKVHFDVKAEEALALSKGKLGILEEV